MITTIRTDNADSDFTDLTAELDREHYADILDPASYRKTGN